MNKTVTLGVILFLLVLSGCQQNQKLPTVEAPSETPVKIVKVEQNPKFSIENLTKEQRAVLDKIISPKSREVLENTEELNLSIGISKKAKVADKSEKRRLLDSVYEQATQKHEPIDCKPTELNTIEAEYKSKKALIKFDFRCHIISSEGFTILL